jgi:anti-sigma B factor antagonist
VVGHARSPGSGPVPWLATEVTFDGDRVLVGLAGELALTTVDQLTRLVADLGRAGSEWELDLAGLTLCDASGLAALVVTHDELQARGGHLTLCGVSPILREVIHLTGLSGVLDIR